MKQQSVLWCMLFESCHNQLITHVDKRCNEINENFYNKCYFEVRWLRHPVSLSFLYVRIYTGDWRKKYIDVNKAYNNKYILVVKIYYNSKFLLLMARFFYIHWCSELKMVFTGYELYWIKYNYNKIQYKWDNNHSFWACIQFSNYFVLLVQL
jgi:hypothetical protein